jgi:hypothetical protein
MDQLLDNLFTSLMNLLAKTEKMLDYEAMP